MPEIKLGYHDGECLITETEVSCSLLLLRNILLASDNNCRANVQLTLEEFCRIAP